MSAPVEVILRGEHVSAPRPPAAYWHPTFDGRVQCFLCFRRCKLQAGESGWCKVRQNVDGELVLTQPYVIATAGPWRYPGPWPREHPVVWYLGSVSCTYKCSFCTSGPIALDPARLPWVRGEPNTTGADSWSYAKALLTPAGAVQGALQHGLKAIHFGSNEMTLSIEWLIEAARLAKEAGLATSLDTNAATLSEPIGDLAKFIDCVHIGIKGSLNPDFLAKHSGAPGVADYVKWGIEAWQRSGTRLEVSDTISPYHWQDDEVFERSAADLYGWFSQTCGPDTPLEIRPMIRPQFPADYETGKLEYLIRRSDGEDGARLVEVRIDRAATIARAAGLTNVVPQKLPRHRLTTLPTEAKSEPVISASELGRQWHLGSKPRPDYSTRPLANTGVHKPEGGFWTSSVDEHGHIDFLDFLSLTPEAIRWRRAWTATPRPDLTVLRLERWEDVAWSFERFRTRDSFPGSIDFEAVRAAGYAGVSVTNRAIAESLKRHPSLHWWHSESTVWFTYPFDAKPEPYDVDTVEPYAIPLPDGTTLAYDPVWILRAGAPIGRLWRDQLPWMVPALRIEPAPADPEVIHRAILYDLADRLPTVTVRETSDGIEVTT